MSAAGALASAQSLLRALGGDAVTVRLPAAPGGGDGEELGLASPEFRDVVLQPALVRLQVGRTAVLVEASAAEAAMGTGGVEAALLSASFVEVQARPYRVEAVERRSVFGRAYLYRLLLRAVERRGSQ